MDSLASRIDPIFAAYDRPDSPGCALAIVRDGEIVYSRGYGCAHLEHGVPITSRTVFHIASASKQFAAMAILLLHQEGRLSVRDDVRRYLPELPDLGWVVTLEHLIHQTSGLWDQWELMDLAGWREDDIKTDADALGLVCRQTRLNFQPGTMHSFCNTGYTLLGLIVRRVSGLSLRAFCQERIFVPLGMERTHFHDDHTMIVRDRASAYAPGRHGLAISIPPYDTVGATSLFTTVEDLARWDRNFYTGQVGGMDVLRWMTTQAVLNNGERAINGGGLQMRQYRGLNVVQHGGVDAGYRAHFMRFPDQRFAVIVLCNYAVMYPTDLAERVADVCLGDVMEPLPPSRLLYDPTEAEIAAKAGTYWWRRTNTTFRLTVRGGRLESSMTPGTPLVFLTPDRLQVGELPIIYEFAPSEPGEPQRGSVPFGPGFMIDYEQVEAVRPSPTELAEYAGDYFSDVLRTTYTMSVHGDRLVLSRARFSDMPLEPAFRDHFAGVNRDVEFVRDGRGRITGFCVFMVRSRGIPFERGR